MPNSLADIAPGVEWPSLRAVDGLEEAVFRPDPLCDADAGDVAHAIAVCDGVIDLLALFFNVSSRQLRSARRTSKPVARVRQIGMYVGHVTLGMTMTAVGAGFGRDKSTVVHACHTIEDMRDDDEFDLVVARVERLICVAFSLKRRARGLDV